MFNYIMRFIKFLLPIFQAASIQIAADTLDDLVRADGRTRPRYRSYRGRRYSVANFDPPYDGPTRDVFEKRPRDMAEADLMERQRINRIRRQQLEDQHFHDVIMVAFDITGPNASFVQKWLMEQMPMPADHNFQGSNIDLDSWWIANDDRIDGTDTDSAVFVPKGKQAEARALLRLHGLIG